MTSNNNFTQLFTLRRSIRIFGICLCLTFSQWSSGNNNVNDTDHSKNANKCCHLQNQETTYIIPRDKKRKIKAIGAVAILRKLERWYKVNFFYELGFIDQPVEIRGKLSKKEPLERILIFIPGIQYRIQNDTIFIDNAPGYRYFERE